MLQGKTAVITGGSRGIGRETAIRLAKDGANVAILATSLSSSAQETMEIIQSLGCDVQFYACDVSNFEEVTSVVTRIMETFSTIDVLVNNAGVTNDKLLMQMKEEDISDVIDINLKGCMYVTKACLRTFVRQKFGRIINVASISGMMGNAGQCNYSASKAGMIGFTKAVAKEYAAKGITCNAVAPGFICTDMTKDIIEKGAEEITKMIPCKRYGKPEEVADLIAFLAKSETSYITGEVIKIDGGMYI